MTEASPYPDPPPIPSPQLSSDEKASDLPEAAEILASNDFPSEDIESGRDLVESPRFEVIRPWYWGIGEALAWFFGTLIVHLIGGISLLIIILFSQFIATGTAPSATQDSQTMILVTAGEMIVFVLAAMLAVSLRYWGRTFLELNLDFPDLKHLAIVLIGTLPLSICVSALSVPIQQGWVLFKQIVPGFDFLDSMNTMEMLKEMSQTTPLWLMILIVALLPAIGEELIFRGAIGRVLIAHLGIGIGIVVTSILFGLIHVHPVHALSVIPLGIAMHVVYFWSRSFWMPVLLHFLNNSWASLLTQSGVADPVRAGASLTMLDYLEMLSAVIAAVLLGIALWQSRVRWFHADGHEWTASRYPIRNPTSKAFHRGLSAINPKYWYIGITCAVVCHMTVIVELARLRFTWN